MSDKIKLHFTGPRTILADVVPLAMPFSIQVEASQVCNIKCNYCMQSFVDNRKKSLMTFSTFVRMCESIAEFDGKLKTINFAGWGEPLVNPYLPSMIKHAKCCHITNNIAVITNGILMTPGVSDMLVEAGTDHIRVSLQGISGKKYKEISGREESFKRIVDNIAHLYNNKGNCLVYVKVADIALDEGDEKRFYDIFHDITDAMYVEKIRPMFQENVQDGKTISKYGEEHSPVLVCPQPFFMMAVTATGDVYPCCSYYDPTSFGNVCDTKLKDIWESREMRSFQKMLLSGKRKEQNRYPVCKTCHMPDAVITPGDELDERAGEVLKRYGKKG